MKYNFTLTQLTVHGLLNINQKLSIIHLILPI